MNAFRRSSFRAVAGLSPLAPRFPPLFSRRTVTTTLTYVPLEEVEHLERYRPGGYCPVVIGDKIHSRYQIIHKLGYGSYSTIWLASDLKMCRYVAVKVSTAESTGTSQEYPILRQLASVKWNDKNDKCAGQANIPPVLDEFVTSSPNGEHQCIVTTPASMSLSDAREASYSRVFQLPVARAMAGQLAQAVDFLHSQGIVHADIHLGNILVRLPKALDNLSPDQFYQKYGQPHYQPIMRSDNQPLSTSAPTHAVTPVWLGKDSELFTLPEASIFLTDFGESFHPSTTARNYSNTPALFAPPEVRFSPQTPLSYPADIWGLACTIYSILGAKPPFEAFAPTDDSMTRQHVIVLGKLPPDWWAKWGARSQWFHEDGTMKNPEQMGKPWAERFERFVQEARASDGFEVVGEEEKRALLAMLRGMLAFKPEERLTAEEVLGCEWMRKWALPEIERM